MSTEGRMTHQEKIDEETRLLTHEEIGIAVATFKENEQQGLSTIAHLCINQKWLFHKAMAAYLAAKNQHMRELR